MNLPTTIPWPLMRGDTPTRKHLLFTPGTQEPVSTAFVEALAAGQLSAQVRRRPNDAESLGELDVSVQLTPPALLIHMPAATSAKLPPVSAADVRLRATDDQGRIFERTLVRLEITAEPDVTR